MIKLISGSAAELAVFGLLCISATIREGHMECVGQILISFVRSCILRNSLEMNGVIAHCGRCVNAIRICPHAKIPILLVVPQPSTLQGSHTKHSILYSRNHITAFQN